MSVLPTPVVTAQNFQAGLYRGLGLAQLAILRNEMAKGKLKISQRRLKLASGLEIVCKITYNIEEVFITLPSTLAPEAIAQIKEIFAFHPRSGPIALLPFIVNDEVYHLVGVSGGGYVNTKELPDVYGYPLVDDDHGTFAVTEKSAKKTIWTIAWTNMENYGNLFWIGLKQDQIVSWRGIPNRHFALSSRTYLPGLSQIEETVGLLDYYSCFGNRVYYKGQVLCELEHTIAGAWFYSGFLVCAAVINKRNTTGGFFFQLMAYRDNVWEKIGTETRLSHRCTYPALPNPAGDRFVFENSCLTLAIDNINLAAPRLYISNVENFEPSTEGSLTVTGTGGHNSTYDYSESVRRVWGECRNAEFRYSTITQNAVFSTSERGSNAPKEYDVPVYRHGPATSLVLTYDNNASLYCPIEHCEHHQPVYVVAIANGSYCSIEWSNVFCHHSYYASFCDNACAVRTQVSATIYPQGITAYLDRDMTYDVLVSGPDNANVGTRFSLINATGSVDWTISSNCSKIVAINSSGVITEGTTYGIITITGTDECGKTASKVIRLPDGHWVLKKGQTDCTCYYQYCNDWSMPFKIYDYSSDGRYMYIYAVQSQCYTNPIDCNKNLCGASSYTFETAAWPVYNGILTHLPQLVDKGTDEYNISGCCGSPYHYRYVCHQGCLMEVYEWSC